MNRLPGFFKVFMLPTSAEQMLIPLSFSAHLNGALPEQALLRNHLGTVWRVKISNHRNSFYFSDGWPKFVEDNDVEHANILVFKYDGSHVFNFGHYGNDTCKKKAIGHTEYDEREYEEREYGEEVNKYTGDESDESYCEETEEEDEEFFEIGNYKKGKEKISEFSKMSQIKKEKGKEKIGEFSKVSQIRKEKGKGKSVKTDSRLAMVVVTSRDDHKGKVQSEGESSDDDSDDEDKIFKYGIIARPKTPFFVSKLRKKRKNELHIPLDLIRDYNLKIPKRISILDEENRKWESDVKVWGDGRTLILWKAFRKRNFVTKADRCICEFVRDMDRRGILLKIKILRKGSWLPKKD